MYTPSFYPGDSAFLSKAHVRVLLQDLRSEEDLDPLFDDAASVEKVWKYVQFCATTKPY